MRKIFKKILSLMVILSLFGNYLVSFGAAADDQNNKGISGYTTLREVDKGTFNEYRYRLTQQFFNLKSKFDVNGNLDSYTLNTIKSVVNASYNFLPSDTLKNQLYKSNLLTAIDRGIKYPNDDSSYAALTKAMGDYMDNADVKAITGSIEASPTSGNAPLTTSLRGRVSDPSGTEIPSYNYIWWIDKGGKRVILGRKQSLSYVFNEEGNYSVFLDVSSSHKNVNGNTDVLGFSSRAIIEVKEKVASLIIKVNNTNLGSNESIKFSPDESRYGLIFDATSSTPTGGAKFVRTTWDFGNGIKKSYTYAPRMERVVYYGEGEYTVKLNLTTNEGKTVEKSFVIQIHKPVATIQSDKDEGYQGDKITFSARSNIGQNNITYAWKVIDIVSDKVVYDKEGATFAYTFNTKGKFNVQLRTVDPAGNEDVDTKIIYINSRAPVADIATSIPYTNKPNYVLLDATKSYDPDFVDDGKLKYTWTIDGEKVQLENPNYNSSVGYYTFSSKGDHSIVLEVVDPDGINDIKKSKLTIASLLSVDFVTFPKVPRTKGVIKFIADSKDANYFEWDFGDGNKNTSVSNSITYIYSKAGSYNMTLKVKNAEGETTTYTKSVYVGNADSPVADITINNGDAESPSLVDDACSGQPAYIVDRTGPITFDATTSINVDGNTSGLTYSWKIGYDNKYSTKSSVTQKFDELGCFPVKLTVKGLGGKLATKQIWVRVDNLAPTFNGLDITTNGDDKDPVIVQVAAQNAKDPDGVVQSYLWYYYTDSDSEPQDFRITNTPTTSFVVPKVTGTYYFVLVMKDSNGARVSSEDPIKDDNGNTIAGNKYFITLASDNVNTPLIDFKVDNSSVGIGSPVTFSASVKNVLGEDLTSKAQYSFDFDGDGFYDEKSTEPTIVHKFDTSGEFHVKVKAMYKGISNTKSITVNVANRLESNFDFISIGNKFIFIDKSIGKVDSRKWDMGDGTSIDTKDLFSYEYEDNKTIHRVSLQISEGTKTDTKTIITKKDVKNELLLNNDGINIVSSPAYNKDDSSVEIPEKDTPFVLYLGASKGDFKYYSIDFDTRVDSDLNGTKDDDTDNLNTETYENGAPIKVTLNDNKTQNIKVSLLDANKKVVSSQEIKVTKDYIKEENIDLDSLSFSGVTDAQRAQIETLKDYVKKLPQESRLKAMKYVEALQSAWFDDREKTQVILDFERYINGITFTDKDNVINLLESFIVENDTDKSTRNMALKVIQGLIPKDDPNYKTIMDKLDLLKTGTADQETAKKIGSEILDIVKNISAISNEDKVTIKAQLQYLIYGNNIPKAVVTEVSNESNTGSTIANIFKNIVYIFLAFIGLLLLVILAFFIYYKIVNKDPNTAFQDFIIEKTSGSKAKVPVSDVLAGIDESIFDNVKEEEKEEMEAKQVREESNSETTSEAIPDWLAGTMNSFSDTSSNNASSSSEIKEESVAIQEEKVPDWLTGKTNSGVYVPPKIEIPEEKYELEEDTFSSESSDVLEEEKTEIIPEEINEKVEDANVPDWLSGAIKESPKKEEAPKKEKHEFKAKAKAAPVESSIPDWLKDSLSTTETKEEVATEIQEESVDEILAKDMAEDAIVSKKDETKIPDWLSGSLKESPSEEKIEETKLPDWLSGSMDNETKSDNSETSLDEDLIEFNEVPTTTEAKLPDWLMENDSDTSKTEEIPEEELKVVESDENPFSNLIFDKEETKETIIPSWDEVVKKEPKAKKEHAPKPTKTTDKKTTTPTLKKKAPKEKVEE
ncbi:MAG: PKD domain-containing protein [Candidatus Gracilibacteria bacterium]|nr:PKD domain-containing protein [Candidatus Gracilibacteria bacterium]